MPRNTQNRPIRREPAGGATSELLPGSGATVGARLAAPSVSAATAGLPAAPNVNAGDQLLSHFFVHAGFYAGTFLRIQNFPFVHDRQFDA